MKEDVRTKEKDDSKNSKDPVESQYKGLRLHDAVNDAEVEVNMLSVIVACVGSFLTSRVILLAGAAQEQMTASREYPT